MITLGNHTWRRSEIVPYLAGSDRVVRPANYSASAPGRGMTGPHDSVIGVQADLAIARMRTGMPVRFRPAEGGVRLEGAVIDCDSSGRATACEPLRVEE